MVSPNGDNRSGVWSLAGISSVPDPANRSGRRSIINKGRVVSDDELSTIQADLKLTADYGTNSPATRVARARDQLLMTLRACLANWRASEELPLRADRDGLDMVTCAFGGTLVVLANEFGKGDRETSEALAAGRFRYAFIRDGSGERVELSIGTSVSEPIGLAGPLSEQAFIRWLAHMLTVETELRDAVLRLRLLVASVIDGAPVLLHPFDGGGPPRTLSWDPITLNDAELCMVNLRNARAYHLDGGPPSQQEHTGEAIDPLEREVSKPPGELAGEFFVDALAAVGDVFTRAADSSNSEPAEAELGEADIGMAEAAPADQPNGDSAESADHDSPLFFDAAFIDLTLMSQGLLDSLANVRTMWSQQMDVAVLAQLPEYDAFIRAFVSVFMRVQKQMDELVLQPAGIHTRLPAFPAPLEFLARSLAEGTDEQRNLLSVNAVLTVFNDLLGSLRSMREATLAEGRNPAAKAFWHDGAFRALMLHLDYFQQTLLQQIDQQSQIAYRRLSPGFTARVPEPGSESVDLAFTVQPRSIIDFYALMTHQSALAGDYLATIFHGRNFLVLASETPGGIGALARRARADDGTADDIRELVWRILAFVDTPRYDLAEIVTLAKATTQIVDLLGAPTARADDLEEESEHAGRTGQTGATQQTVHVQTREEQAKHAENKDPANPEETG